MGMAASQARFLGLTARKTNIEYRGQQINQARLALANETSNLYNQMLSLKVPTPPVVSDFYKASYTFEEGDKTGEIISGLGTESCQIRLAEKMLKNYSQKVNSGYPSSLYYEDGVPYLNGFRLTKLSGDTEGSNVSPAKLESILKDGVELSEEAPFILTNGVDKISIKNWREYQEAVEAGYAFAEDESNNILFNYTKSGSAYYIQGTYVPENDGQLHKITIPQEFYEKDYVNYITETMTNCDWTKDKSGRYASVGGTIDGEMKSYSLLFSQEEDEIAYEQAMLDYEYSYAQYQKAIEDINAKTAKIQEQDRGLELQLRECDTEQESLKTELDAIKKIIDDNVNRVFKTFQNG